MAYAISTGDIFLGELTTQKNKVQIIQSDESKNNALDKLELMNIDGSNSNLYFYFAENGWDRLNIKNLKEEVLKKSFNVVLLDSVTTLLTNNGRSMRDPEFATPLYELNKSLALRELSMGMSADYLEAIKYSATFVRIGSSIFGSRS